MASGGWGFGNLWGGNAAKKKDSTKNAILGLRSTLEMLSKREKHLENQMNEQDAIARKNVSTNKGGESDIRSWWHDAAQLHVRVGADMGVQWRRRHYDEKRPSSINWNRLQHR